MFVPTRRLSKKLRIWLIAVLSLLMACTLLVFLIYEGLLIPNQSSANGYSIRGVDVSSYQGEIDWQELATQRIDFAFIKATEGATHTDRCFASNWDNALATDLRVSAYHFFSYDSSGTDQAAHFIEVVPKVEGMLPPVVDVEFYGDYFDDPANADEVIPELTALLDALEAHYGVSPIIYVTEAAYELYIADRFTESDIWIRDVWSKPTLSDGRSPTFWQYTSRMKLDGYDGKERFIDMNVFCGSEEEFRDYPK